MAKKAQEELVDMLNVIIESTEPHELYKLKICICVKWKEKTFILQHSTSKAEV
jgi:hypothetical protein